MSEREAKKSNEQKKLKQLNIQNFKKKNMHSWNETRFLEKNDGKFHVRENETQTNMHNSKIEI